MKVALALITACIALPIWYYLLYQMLLRVNASELMWFLYYLYVPAGLLGHILSNLIAKERK